MVDVFSIHDFLKDDGNNKYIDDGDPSKIISFDISETMVYLGTDAGKIMNYNIKKNPSNGCIFTKFVQFIRSNKSIDYLSFCSEINLLIVISNEKFIALNHDLKQCSIKIPKIINIICCKKEHVDLSNETNKYYNYLIGTKKKIIYLVKITVNTCSIISQFNIPDIPTNFLKLNDKLLISYRDQYCLFDIQNKTNTILFKFESSFKSVLIDFKDNKVFIKGPHPNMGMIIDHLGDPITPPIVFPSETINAHKFLDFVFILLIDCTIIYNHDFSMTIQIIDIPGLFNTFSIENSLVFLSSKSLYIISKITPIIQIEKLLSQYKYLEIDDLLNHVWNQKSFVEYNDVKRIIKTNLMITNLSNNKLNSAKDVLAENEIDISILINIYSKIPFDSSTVDRFKCNLLVINKIEKLLKQDSVFNETFKEFLIESLEIYRQKPQSINLLTFIDNNLLQLYITTASDKLNDFLRNPNYCSVEGVEEFLVKTKFSFILGYLLFSNGDQKGGVNSWKDLAFSNNIPTNNYEDCFQALKHYIYKISDENLFWETLDWCFLHFGSKSVQIILDIPNNLNLNFPVTENQMSALLEKHKSFHLIYLKHLIEGKKTVNIEMHNKYAQLLLKELNFHYTLNPQQFEEYSLNFNIFLKSSNIYDPAIILNQIDKISFLQNEKIILLKKLKRHHEALSIIVNDFDDIEQAITYCKNQIHNEECKTTKDLFLTLLQLIKAKGIKYNYYIDHILNNYSHEMDYKHVSEYISEESRIKSIQKFINYFSLKFRRDEIVSSIASFLIHKNLYHETTKFVHSNNEEIKITENDLCTQCGVHFTDSVVVRKNDGKCYHVYCDSKSSK